MENQANHDMETSSLLSTIHGANMCYVVCKGSKTINNHSCKIQIFNLGRYVQCCNYGANTMGATKFFLIGLKAHSRRLNSCLVLLPGSTT